MKKLRRLEDLTPDPQNANRGTKRGLDLLDRSLERLGAGRSIVVDKNGVVIAGNKTFERAADRGFPIQVVRSCGQALIVIQREDLDMHAPDDSRARELALADNRVGQVDLDWDPHVLLHGMEGVDVSAYFFDHELATLARVLDDATNPDAEIAKGGPRLHKCPQCGFES